MINQMNYIDESCGWQSKRDAKIEKLKDMEEAYLSEVEARLKCEAEIERIRMEYAEYRSVWTRRLADELEAAMSEPVAERVLTERGLEWEWYWQDPPVGTKLYAIPPDAAGEIARLHADLETAERALDAQTDFRKEIEGLEAHIDALMLEFCPDEMTPEQIQRWGENQRPVEEDKP
jgi:hypothetical protein